MHTHHHIIDRNASKDKMQLVLGIIFVYMLIELVTGLMCRSLALIADSGHMLSDAGGIILGLLAIWFASKPATQGKTYGYYRSEILVSFINALVLVLITGVILYQSYNRFKHPEIINSLPVFFVAMLGVFVNFLALKLLGSDSNNSLNVKAIYLELLSDLYATAGVMLSSIIGYFTHWYQIDSIVSALIAVAILYRTWVLIGECTHILMEGSPGHINIAELRKAILAIEGVVDVHDIHVWTITSGLDSMSAHVIIVDDKPSAEILDKTTEVLNNDFHLHHTTIQVEKVSSIGTNVKCEPCPNIATGS